MISGAEPNKVVSDTLLISTISSAMSLCPLFTNSKAVSLFPTPLSPSIRIPSPYTSTITPCFTILGASCTLRYLIRPLRKFDVISLVLKIGIWYLLETSIISGKISKPLVITIHGKLSLK